MKKKKLTGILTAILMSVCLFSMSVFGAGILPEDVIIGKDGWLFYAYGMGVADYQGTDLFEDYELSNIRLSLGKMKNYFDGKGIPFIIFLIPNRERVYSEYMPDEYGPAASYTRIEQLCDYLGDEFTIITPYQAMIDAKQRWPEYDFCYKTDAHWNELGAYIGTELLMDTLNDPLPDFSSLTISPVATRGRELSEPLGLQDEYSDTYYDVSGFGPYMDVTLTIEDDDENYYHYHSEGAPEKNIIIYGDSFALAMPWYLGQKYENIYLHRLHYYKSDIEVEQPSAVVIELVERSLDYLKFYGFSD